MKCMQSVGGRSPHVGAAALVALALTVTAIGLAACGDDGDEGGTTTAAVDAELKQRLVPPEQVKLEPERGFEWDNATDFVVQGMYSSEGTAPSELIGPIDDAGFTAAAGEILKDTDGEVFAFVGAAAFDSEDGAATALDTVHAEDLKQPCFAACVVSPIEYTVEGIPSSAAVHHVPNEGKPPPGLFPVEAYHVEFTIGSDLYLFQVSGPPGLSEADFDRNAKAVYEYVTAHD